MAKFSDLDRLLEEFAGKTVPGCNCILAKNGEILYEGAAGMADREAGKPMTLDTVCRLYSMTKVIVCTAGMIQYERGKFLLNEPYSNYFPEYKDVQVAEHRRNGNVWVRPAKKPVLVRDTFHMSVGLPYPDYPSYTAGEMKKIRAGLAAKGKYTLQDDVRAMAQAPLQFDPGTHWVYGFGHEMVAALVEVTSGMTIGEFLQKEIFEPLGMESSGYRYFGDIADRMARVYRREAEGVFTPVTLEGDANFAPDAVYEGGGSGLFSTARDYTKFAQMLANGGQGIIGRNTIDLMRRDLLTEAQRADFTGTYNEGYGYGLGVRVMQRPEGVANVPAGEFGWTGMAGTWTSIEPSSGFTAVYMHQMDPNDEEYHHCRVRAVAYGCLE